MDITPPTYSERWILDQDRLNGLQLFKITKGGSVGERKDRPAYADRTAIQQDGAFLRLCGHLLSEVNHMGEMSLSLPLKPRGVSTLLLNEPTFRRKEPSPFVGPKCWEVNLSARKRLTHLSK